MGFVWSDISYFFFSGSFHHLMWVFLVNNLWHFKVKYTSRLMLALWKNDPLIFFLFSNLEFISEKSSWTQSKLWSVQSVNKTCVFCSLAQKKLPCGVCYWKLVFGIIFLITGLSLGILPPPLKSSAICTKQTEMQSSTVIEIYFYCSKNWLSIFHNQF